MSEVNILNSFKTEISIRLFDFGKRLQGTRLWLLLLTVPSVGKWLTPALAQQTICSLVFTLDFRKGGSTVELHPKLTQWVNF
jgi:hypothetical protein